MMLIYKISVTYAITLMCFVVIPNIVVGYEHFCDWLDELSYRRKRRKYLLSEYRKWYDKAISCDNFGGAIYKGKAIAMLVVINHELKEL